MAPSKTCFLAKSLLTSVLIVHTLNPGRHTGQHFVRNGVERIGQHCDRQMVAEDFHRIAFLAVNVRHVDHADVHTNVTHIRSALAVDQAIGVSVAQMVMNSI